MNISAKIIGGGRIGAEEMNSLCRTETVAALCEAADEVRRAFHGKYVDTCSIMNARSGRCSENCKWCAQSAHYSTGCSISDYSTVEDALRHAAHFKKKGVRRFSLVTSGRTVSADDIDKLCAAFEALRSAGGIELCGSFGLLDKDAFVRLAKAGMTRFHCNLETAPSYFPKLCTTHTVGDKIQTIRAAKSVGLSICSGGIIGMGETRGQRIELSETLAELSVDSIPVNILQPIKGTPLEDTPPIAQDEILLSFAIFRLMNPRSHIRFAGGRLAIKNVQERALLSGVSAILMGDMLTTVGSGIDDDFKMLSRLGYEY